MVMTLGDRIRKAAEERGKEEGREQGREQGILIGELKGELGTLRKLQMEGILSREQYHAKAEPVQAKLDALLAEEEAKTKRS